MRIDLSATLRRTLFFGSAVVTALPAMGQGICQPCCPPTPSYCPPAYSEPGMTDATGQPTPSGEPSETQQQQPANVPEIDFSPAPNAGALAAASGSQTNFAPNMIGDTSQGGCGGLRIRGDIVATLDHPTYACSRLNIAENNSALVRDRVYFTYRHYHNASGFDFFSGQPDGLARDFDINQYLLAFEKRLNCYTSLEFRVPLLSQLSSDLTFEQFAAGTPPNNLGDIGTDTDFGNLSLILKQQLISNRCNTVSWGVGVNIPTAPDLQIRAIAPAGSIPGLTEALDTGGVYRNETVNVQPFLAYLSQPSALWFSQGFLQVDVPVNEASGQIDGEEGELAQQLLLRANFGIGRWLTDPRCSGPKTAALLEVHYTGTLNSPDTASDRVLIDNTDPFNPEFVDVLIGPLANSTNSVNLVTGFATQIGATSIYNGFGVPLTEGMDKGFDFEYSLSINRYF